MQIIEVLKPFKWSPDGFTVHSYDLVGQIVQVDDECATTEAEQGNAAILTADDLARAQAAHARLAAAADKAEAAADKAEAAAAELRAKATTARERAGAAPVGRQAEAAAAELGADDQRPADDGATGDAAPQASLLPAADQPAQ